MAYRKSSKNQVFTVVYQEVSQHETMTMEARGLLLFMLSLPDDWDYHKGWLQDQCKGWGRDKLTKVLKELEQNGFLIRTPKRSDDKKTLAGWDWEVLAEADIPEERIFSQSDNQSDGDSTATNKTVKESKQTTTTATENFSNSPTTSQEKKDRNSEELDAFKSQVVDHMEKQMFPGSELDPETQDLLLREGASLAGTGCIPADIPEPTVEYIKKHAERLFNKYKNNPCPITVADYIIRDWLRLHRNKK